MQNLNQRPNSNIPQMFFLVPEKFCDFQRLREKAVKISLPRNDFRTQQKHSNTHTRTQTRKLAMNKKKDCHDTLIRSWLTFVISHR